MVVPPPARTLPHRAPLRPEQAYTIPGFADDVAWMIGELGLDRPVVIGHSMGGAIALQQFRGVDVVIGCSA